MGANTVVTKLSAAGRRIADVKRQIELLKLLTDEDGMDTKMRERLIKAIEEKPGQQRSLRAVTGVAKTYGELGFGVVFDMESLRSFRP